MGFSKASGHWMPIEFLGDFGKWCLEPICILWHPDTFKMSGLHVCRDSRWLQSVAQLIVTDSTKKTGAKLKHRS